LRWGRVKFKKLKIFRKGEKIMKNRRNIIISFLLCACLIVGVGYAAMTDALDVTGTVDYNMDDAFDSLIEFTGATAVHSGTSSVTDDTASINRDNSDKVSFTVNSVKSANDAAYFYFQITNTENELELLKGKSNNTNIFSIINLGKCGTLLKEYYKINL
jgi:hypothetical protein